MKFFGIIFIVTGIILGSISISNVTPHKRERGYYSTHEAIQKSMDGTHSLQESCHNSMIFMMSSSFCFSLGFGLFFLSLARKPQDNLIQNENNEVKEENISI